MDNSTIFTHFYFIKYVFVLVFKKIPLYRGFPLNLLTLNRGPTVIPFCFSVQIQFSLSLIYKLADSLDILDSHEKKIVIRDGGATMEFFCQFTREKLDRFRKSSKIQQNHEFFLGLKFHQFFNFGQWQTTSEVIKALGQLKQRFYFCSSCIIR